LEEKKKQQHENSIRKHKHSEEIFAYLFAEVETKNTKIRQFSESSG
jgi:hypothetical protein